MAAGVVLALLPAVLPFIGNVVTAVEALFSHKPGAGSSKKDAAFQMIKAGLGVLQAVEQAPGSPLAGSQLDSHISSAIDSVVGILNDVGVFRHSSPSPPTAVAPAPAAKH